MYVRMRRKPKGGKSSRAPWMAFLEFEQAAETGCGSYRVPLSSFGLMSGFKNAWHSISGHFMSLFVNSLFWFANRKVSGFYPISTKLAA